MTSSAILEALLEGVGEGACLVDRDNRLLLVNRRFSELLGLPADLTRPGLPAAKLFAAVDGSMDLGDLAALRRAAPFRRELAAPEGKLLELRVTAMPESGLMVTVGDLTKLQRLEATEDMLRDALDSIVDGFAVFDSNDRLVLMNKRYVGYTPERSSGPQLGITFEALMNQDRRHSFYPDVVGHETPFIERRIAAHREGKGRPINFRTSDGHWAQARDYRLADGSTVVVRTDVSELVERDRSLRESQANLAAAQRVAKLGSWELELTDPGNLDGSALSWSDETFRILGYEPNQIEVSNESFFHAVHPEDREKVRQTIRRAIETGETASVEHRVLRPDGGEIVVQEIADVIPDAEGGRRAKVVGTIQDITLQRAAERRRDELRSLLEATSEASADGILVTDSDGRYLFWNRRFQELWSLTDDYLQSRRAGSLAGGADVSPFTDQIQEPRLILDEIVRIYRQGEAPKPLIPDVVFKDGRVIERHAARVAAGRLPFAIVAWIYRDVTEQRKRDAALAEAERLATAGELSGGMAHELNNLLMVIGGNLELIEMQQRASGGSQTGQFLKVAHAAVERGAELIRQLLTFSRRQPLVPRPTDLNAFVGETMGLLARLLGDGVAVQFRPGERLWQTVVDRGFLQTTLVSLATNARDAMPGGGSLVIETANLAADEAYVLANPEVGTGDYVMVSVIDDGEGMTPDVAKRAFEPFFTTKPVGKGTGLGLSVVYGFVKQSGGHVAIRSEPGRGTAVRIYLPRALGEAPARGEAAPAPAALGNKESILLLEDDAAVRAIAKAFLVDLGYRVLEARHGGEALALLRSGEPVDLLFTDVVLADGTNGDKVAREAERLRPGLKVLFASGHTQEALVHEGRLDPGVKLLATPYRKRDLAQAVKALL